MRVPQSHLGGRRKQSQVRRERGTWEGKWMGGIGEERGKDWNPLGQQKEWKQAISGGRKWGGGLSRMHQSPGRWETLRTQREGTLDEMPDSRERELIELTSSRKTGHQMKEGRPTHRHNSDHCSCLKELQGWKWRGAWGIEGPVTGPRWDPAQGEVPRPDTITEAMEHSHKGTYHDCPLKDPISSWKSQLQILDWFFFEGRLHSLCVLCTTRSKSLMQGRFSSLIYKHSHLNALHYSPKDILHSSLRIHRNKFSIGTLPSKNK
jgi:hypothetical protein